MTLKNTDDYIVITSYPCPLCGKDVRDHYFWYGRRMGEEHFIYDLTPCCHVVVAFIIIDMTPIYLGTFRNQADLDDWCTSAGGYRADIGAAGQFWDVEQQRKVYPWRDDEIPF